MCIKRIAAFAAAAVIAAGLCAAVPADSENRNAAVINASAAESDSSDTIGVYGTSTEAVVNIFVASANKYSVSLYDPETGRYEKKKEFDSGYGMKITGLKPNTKYKIKVEAFEVKNGKSVRKYSGKRTFTTKKQPNGKSLKAKDGTSLSIKRSAYFDLRSRYGGCELPEFDKAYLIAYNSGVNVFGYLPDLHKEDPSRDYGFYTYISHSGTVDILPQRNYNFKEYNVLGSQFIKDIDGDGTDEIVSILPESSGVASIIDSLTVYDMDSSGHYREHTFPNLSEKDFRRIMKKTVSIKVDSKNEKYTLTSLNSDAVYTGSTNNYGNATVVTSMEFSTNLCRFYSDDKGRIYIRTALAFDTNRPEVSFWEDMDTAIISEVVYDGRDFSLKNTRFGQWD